MAWTVTVSRSELKALRATPEDVQDWAARTIVLLHEGPGAVNAEPLTRKGAKFFKVRHGAYRLIFEVLPGRVIDVPVIDHRSAAYKRFAKLR